MKNQYKTLKPKISCTRQKQKGVVLFIALIVLVAMTLAGIGMLRSVDTGNLISGNLAFKQSTLNASDLGIETAFQWLLTQAGTTALDASITASGYYANPPANDATLDWTDIATGVGQSYWLRILRVTQPATLFIACARLQVRLQAKFVQLVLLQAQQVAEVVPLGQQYLPAPIQSITGF